MFCADLDVGLTLPFTDVFEKRDPILPIAAKVGIKAGAALGKELFFDDKRDLADIQGREAFLPIAAKVGIKAGSLIGKELFFDNKRDLESMEKRQPVLPIAAKVGIKAGAMLGKKLFFDEKRDVAGHAERDAFIEFNPSDDSPFNPFDDPGVIGKREAQSGLKDAINWWANEVNDDSPLNPFDDSGVPGKRSAEAQPFIKDVLDKVIPQDENDDTSFNPLDGTLNIFRE